MLFFKKHIFKKYSISAVPFDKYLYYFHLNLIICLIKKWWMCFSMQFPYKEYKLSNHHMFTLNEKLDIVFSVPNVMKYILLFKWWKILTHFFNSYLFQAASRMAKGGPLPLTCPPCLRATTSSWQNFASACPPSPSLPEPQWTSTTHTGGAAPARTAQRTGCSWAAWKLTPAPRYPPPPGRWSTWRGCSVAGCSRSTPHRRKVRRKSRRESNTLLLTGSWWWSSQGRTWTTSACQHSSAQQSTPSTSALTGREWPLSLVLSRGAAGPTGTSTPSTRGREWLNRPLSASPQRRRRRVLSARGWTW